MKTESALKACQMIKNVFHTVCEHSVVVWYRVLKAKLNRHPIFMLIHGLLISTQMIEDD